MNDNRNFIALCYQVLIGFLTVHFSLQSWADNKYNEGFKTTTVGQEPLEKEETIDLYNKMIDFE